MKPATLIQFAGFLHLGLLAAGLTMPRAVNLRHHLASLPGFIRRLFWVYYVFIGFTFCSLGAASILLPQQIVTGGPMARAFCLFAAVFWAMRLGVAIFVFDVHPYLTNSFYRLGYHLTNVVFAALPLIYGWVAWRN